MSGILCAIRLRELGIDFTVHEKADRLGGTWRENTYPGLACDVPAHSYTYSFARNPDWSRFYAGGAEIQEYFLRVAAEHDVERNVRFGSEVVRLEHRDGRWDLRTADGHTDRVDVVLAATGVLHHPNIPHFDGIDSFRGASFHSARWDHSVPLDAKRVGVIGTGSTAVQLTSALVPRVEHFSLFQRTAQWVAPGDNPEFTEEEKAAFRSDPEAFESYIRGLAQGMVANVAHAVIEADSPKMARIEQACRRNLDRVRDPELKAKLTPTYRAACKRLVFASDFYEKVQEPNVSVVVSGIERIEPEGVRTRDGQLHELDVLVLATGFHPDRFIRPTTVIGRNGVDLDDVWREGPLAHLAITVPGFPNFFMLNGPNSPIGNFSLIDVAEQQLAYVLRVLEPVLAGEAREVAPTEQALRDFEAERKAAAVGTIWMTGCKSWYLGKDGVPASWTFTYDRFVEEMATPKREQYEYC